MHREAVYGGEGERPGSSPQGVSPASGSPWVGHFASLGPGSSSLKWEAGVRTPGDRGRMEVFRYRGLEKGPAL